MGARSLRPSIFGSSSRCGERTVLWVGVGIGAGMSAQVSEQGSPAQRCPDGDPDNECWRVGRRVRVLYEEEGDDGKAVKRWYPAVITAYTAENEAPYTLLFETGDTEDVQLPDPDTRPMPDGPCSICDKSDCYTADMFVQCAGCALTVHQGCYGIRSFPADRDWFCDLCANDPSRPALVNVTQCVLCGKRGGALKPTVDKRYHAHLACVIWIPEAHVVDTPTMGPVEIRHIPVSRQRLRCSLCKTKETPLDAPVQCYEPTCARRCATLGAATAAWLVYTTVMRCSLHVHLCFLSSGACVVMCVCVSLLSGAR